MNSPVYLIVMLVFAALAAVFAVFPSLEVNWLMSGGVPMSRPGRLLLTAFLVVMSAVWFSKDHASLKVVILNFAGIILVGMVPAYFYDRRANRSQEKTSHESIR